MNIKLVWDFFPEYYKELFPETELFNYERDAGTEIDLLIFPGGEDVSIDLYADRDTIRELGHFVYSNKERDDFEFKVLDDMYNGIFRAKKILGVCRGLQFLNVAAGGKLFPDLAWQGISHSQIHEIRFAARSNLDFLTNVNSMHHQGISDLGRYNRLSDRAFPTIVATDKRGYVPEIVVWENDRILGVQFHPEFFWENNPDKAKFREFCYEWIAGNKTVLK